MFCWHRSHLKTLGLYAIFMESVSDGSIEVNTCSPLAALHMFPLTQSHIVGLLLGWMALGDTATLLAMACMAGILEELNYLYMLNGLQLLYQ